MRPLQLRVDAASAQAQQREREAAALRRSAVAAAEQNEQAARQTAELEALRDRLRLQISGASLAAAPPMGWSPYGFEIAHKFIPLKKRNPCSKTPIPQSCGNSG